MSQQVPLTRPSILDRLINIQSRLIFQIINIPLVLILYSFFPWGWIGALFILINLIVHELAHAFAFRINGVKYDVMLLFPVGAVAYPKNQEEETKALQLKDYTLAMVVMAGPCVHGLFLLVGYLLTRSHTWHSMGIHMIYTNALCAISCLWPLAFSDGEKLIHGLFDTMKLSGSHRLGMAFGIGAACIILLHSFVLIHHSDPFAQVILGIFLFAWGLFIVALLTGLWCKKEQPDTVLAMTEGQAFIHMLLYFVLAAIPAIVLYNVSGIAPLR